MSETDKHMALVTLMKDVILKRADIEPVMLFVDSPDAGCNYPPNIGFRPDIYYNFNNCLIIGEAKTKNDINNFHTKGQLETYISACSNHSGESCLYFAVPWAENATATNLIISTMKKLGVKIKYKIIDEMSKL